MNANKTLKKHEDKNEFHFHRVDREWIIEAMEDYAKQKAWEAWKEAKIKYKGYITYENTVRLAFEKWWEENK